MGSADHGSAHAYIGTAQKACGQDSYDTGIYNRALSPEPGICGYNADRSENDSQGSFGADGGAALQKHIPNNGYFC